MTGDTTRHASETVGRTSHPTPLEDVVVHAKAVHTRSGHRRSDIITGAVIYGAAVLATAGYVVAAFVDEILRPRRGGLARALRAERPRASRWTTRAAAAFAEAT